MDVVIVGLIGALVLLMAGALVSSIISAARVEHAHWRAAKRSKSGTIALIVLTGGFGGLLYWWRIRPELSDAAGALAAAPGARTPTAAELRAIAARDSLR